MSAKILLVRTGPDIFQAKAYVAVETGLYARDIPSVADLETSLKSEQFDLVIQDGFKLGKDLLNLAENIRGHQRNTPILLLCARPETDMIVRAIRLGVRDLFHPPLNLSAFFARATELLQPRLNGHTATIAHHCRHEMTLFLAGENRPGPVQLPVSDSSAVGAELETLRAECDRLSKQLKEETDRRATIERDSKTQAEKLAERERALMALEKEKQQAEKRGAEPAKADKTPASLRAELEAAKAMLAEKETALSAERRGCHHPQQRAERPDDGALTEAGRLAIPGVEVAQVAAGGTGGVRQRRPGVVAVRGRPV